MDEDKPEPPLPPPLGGEIKSSPPLADLEDYMYGSVEVTSRCCGAMTCRVLAPDIFLEAKQGSGPSDAPTPGSNTPTNNFTYVGREIKNEEELRQVRRAVKACPFHALRMHGGTKGREDVNDAYPLPVGSHGEVFLLGHYTPKNTGASSYLIVPPKGGTVLIDAPSPDASLVERVKSMGEVRYMVFSHKDHTTFHQEWFEALGGGVQRVMHVADVVQERGHFFFPYTGEVEIKVGKF
jgi:ferredoxin